MRAVTIYLIIYGALVAGALFALWQGGALPQIGATRITLALALAIGLGAVLALASGRAAPAQDPDAPSEEGLDGR